MTAMKINKKMIPNIITSIRIIGAVLLLVTWPFTTPFSFLFYFIYTLCGFSDCVDGTVARLTDSCSETGTKLDSIADLIFYTVTLIIIFPALVEHLPKKIWYGVGAVIFVRLLAYLAAFLKYHCFASIHTWGNKLTGASLFMVPYIINQSFFTVVCTVICVIAGLASLEELIIHLVSESYSSEKKSLIGVLTQKKKSKPAV